MNAVWGYAVPVLLMCEWEVILCSTKVSENSISAPENPLGPLEAGLLPHALDSTKMTKNYWLTDSGSVPPPPQTPQHCPERFTSGLKSLQMWKERGFTHYITVGCNCVTNRKKISTGLQSLMKKVTTDYIRNIIQYSHDITRDLTQRSLHIVLVCTYTH